MQRVPLKGFSLQELQEFVSSLEEPKFRAKQLFDWLYTKEADSFEEMSSLAKPFRSKLTDMATIARVRMVNEQKSHTDGTTKLLFELADGKRVESVLIPRRSGFDGKREPSASLLDADRLTLCLSTQVGCPLDCAFCATATMDYERNLDAGEIVDQLTHARRAAGRNITNIVYMGMGEPLMNYENVMKSVEIISTAMGVAARRITISTAGWAERIRRMADEGRKAKLAISLHSTRDDVRTKLMPINKKFPVRELLDAVRYYYKKIKQRVTYEYILFDGINDTERDLHDLIKFVKAVPSKVNIVPFHSIAFTHPDGFAASLHPTPSKRVEKFVEGLRSSHITVMIRSNAGEDIDAACGQLALSSHSIPATVYA